MRERGHLLNDRQSLLAFSLVVGGFLIYNGALLFWSALPLDSLWADLAPREPTSDDTPPGAPESVEPEVRGDPPKARRALLQAGGGFGIVAYGLFRWGPGVAGDWLPPHDEGDEEE